MPKLIACHKWRENALFNAGNKGGGDKEACSEPSTSHSKEKITSSRTYGFMNRKERASSCGKAVITNDQLSLGCFGDLFVTPYLLT